MIYNSSVSYNDLNYSYSGTLIIYAPSLSLPIILNNITVFFVGEQDYSNYSIVSFTTIDVDETGNITIEVLDEDVSALLSIESIGLTHNSEIAIIA